MKINSNNLSNNSYFTANISPYFEQKVYDYYVQIGNQKSRERVVNQFKNLRSLATDEVNINYRKISNLSNNGENIFHLIYLNDYRNVKNKYKLLVKETTFEKALKSFLNIDFTKVIR